MDKQHKVVISPADDDLLLYLKKIWQYRYLVWVFAQRDIKVKYAQTLLGIGWTILQPLTAMFVFSFFFGYLLSWQTDGLPYPVYVLSGLLGWNFFSYIVYSGSGSVQESSAIIKKIYFPKSILPLSIVLVALIELILSILIFITVLVYFNTGISWKIVFLPIVLLFNAACALTLVFGVAAFAYRRRDLFHVLPFVVYFGIWITPVFFTPGILPAPVRFAMRFNPMSSVIDLWRWMLFGYNGFDPLWVLSFVTVLLLCIISMFFYNRNETKFSDFS